jgi:hypothetical protein
MSKHKNKLKSKPAETVSKATKTKPEIPLTSTPTPGTNKKHIQASETVLTLLIAKNMSLMGKETG